jgi:hypothetical protein
MKSRVMKKLITIAALSVLCATGANADGIWPKKSLRFVCNSNEETKVLACTSFIHGAVETWMRLDLVGVSPTARRYSATRGPVFCETILNVSADEWRRIVQERLQVEKDDDGFAVELVVYALYDKLCKLDK